MLKRKYNRIFILLNGINEGLSENINGSCDIEIINGRGKLYAYAGGMGRLKDKPRTVYLISAGIKGSVAIPAGMFENRGSNAVLEVSFDPDDMFGSGVCVEDINAAAVWGPDESPARSVMEGYVSHKVNWMKDLEIFGSKRTRPAEIINKTQKNESIEAEEHNGDAAKEIERKILEFEKSRSEIQEDTPEEYRNLCEESSEISDDGKNIDEETKIKEDIEEEAPDDTILRAAEAALEEKLSPHDTFRLIAEKFRRELDMLDEMGVLDKSLLLGEFEKKTEAARDSETSTEETAEKTVSKSEGFSGKTELEKLFEKNERLNVGGGTLWVRADYREMYFIPSAIEELRKAFVKNSARKGNHVIAGRNGEKYYIGVPGNEDGRTSAEKNGFFDFLSVDGRNNGYWIKELEKF